MDFKKILLPLLLIFMLASANADTITLVIAQPTDGQTFLPNAIFNDRVLTLELTVTDSFSTIGEVPVHTLTAQFNNGDSNVLMFNDVNMTSANCAFATVDGAGDGDNNFAAATTCTYFYTFPVDQATKLTTGRFVIDANVTGFNGSGDFNTSATQVRIINVDNRWIDASVEALLAIISLVLIAALLVGIVLAMTGRLDMQMVLGLAVAAIISVVAVVVLSIVLGILTP